MKKNKKQEEGPNSERWMLSYADFMTLLMIFFVVMYAMGQVDQSKYKELAMSLNIAMGGGKTIIGSDNTPSVKDTVKQVQDTDPSQDDQSETQIKLENKKLEELKKEVDSYLAASGLSQSASTQIDERGLVVSLNNSLFFDTGKADIRPQFQQQLIDLGKILNQLGNYIRIEGHTDNVPISNSQYSSNWELSCDRASNVTEFFIKNSGVQPERLSAIGYGEYRPVGDNSVEEGRAKNRRVDIVILNSKFNAVEQNSNNSSSDK